MRTGCAKDTAGMMRVGNANYILVTGFKDSTDVIRELYKRKRDELIGRYGITEGTCTAAILDELLIWTTFDNQEDEVVPYSWFLRSNKFKEWSESTVRKNVRKLESIGVLRIGSWDNVPEGTKENILRCRDNFFEKTGYDLKKIYSKVVASAEKLSVAKYEELDRLNDKMAFIPGLFCGVYGADDHEATLMPDERILLKEDVRGWTLEEKAERLMEVYRSFKRKPDRVKEIAQEHEGETTKLSYLSGSELVKATKHYAEMFQSMSHIKEVRITGSLVNGDVVRGSDIDLLLSRYDCPDKEACLGTLPRTDAIVDIFCYTPEEIEELERSGALITFFSLPYEQWKKELQDDNRFT